MSRLADRLQKALGSRFRIGRELGSGARGVVYEAADPKLLRSVAIKVLRPEHATAAGAARFLHEARCLARINHPGLVAVHEVGEGDGLFFYVMDLVEGRTLAETIAAGPSSLEDVACLADGLLAALATAHEAGVVHRDVKPANIFFTEGRVVLADFGIAKTVTSSDDRGADADNEALTADGGFVGTPAYSSPEQLAGQGDDPRSDLFSAAAVIYEMATGRRWQQVAPGAPDTWDGVPPAVATTLAKGLHPSVAERWEDASSFHEALAGAFSKGSTAGTPGLRWLVAIAFAATVIGGVAIVRSGAFSAGGGSDGLIGSIAVLCDGGGASDGLAHGLEEKLRHAFGALDVVVPGPYSRDRVREVGFSEAGASLGVDAALECRILPERDSVRLFGRLVETESQRQLWSGEFHLANASAFQMQDSVTRAIVRAVLPHLYSDLPAARGDGPSRLALELYQSGEQFWLARTTDPSGAVLDSAEFYFELAIGQYPEYADAHAGLAEVWLARPARVLAPAAEAYPVAESLANVALRLDSLNPRPYAILGELVRTDPFGDWTRAEELFERSLELSRNHALGRLWYSFYLAQVGRDEEARTQARLAYEGDPGRPDLATGLGLVHYLTGANDSAIVLLSDAFMAHGGDFETPLWLAAAHIAAGDTASAAVLIRALDEQRAGLPPAVYPMLAVGHAATGRSGESSDLLLLVSPDESPFWQAVAYWYLDRRDESLDRLRRAVQVRDEFLSYVDVLPILDPMRDDSGFRETVMFVGKGEEP